MIQPHIRISEMAAFFHLRIISIKDHLIITTDIIRAPHVVGRGWRGELGSEYDQNMLYSPMNSQRINKIYILIMEEMNSSWKQGHDLVLDIHTMYLR